MCLCETVDLKINFWYSPSTISVVLKITVPAAQVKQNSTVSSFQRPSVSEKKCYAC